MLECELTWEDVLEEKSHHDLQDKDKFSSKIFDKLTELRDQFELVTKSKMLN